MKKTQKNLSFSKRLRLWREKRGLSRPTLAKKIGLSNPSQISRYESGKAFPNVTSLEKIAKVLDVDLHWLITGKCSPEALSVIDHIRPYAMAHLSDVTINLQKLERERRDLYVRDAQGENLHGAIKDIEALIEKQHRYYEKAFQEIDEVLDVATHRQKD